MHAVRHDAVQDRVRTSFSGFSRRFISSGVAQKESHVIPCQVEELIVLINFRNNDLAGARRRISILINILHYVLQADTFIANHIAQSLSIKKITYVVPLGTRDRVIEASFVVVAVPLDRHNQHPSPDP